MMSKKSKAKKVKRGLNFKLTLGIAIMAIALAVALTTIIAVLYRNKMEDYYSDIAFNQASIAANHIDGDTIQKYYTTGEKDDYYFEVQDYLQMSAETIGAEYFYVVVPEDDVMVYIWDTGEEDGTCELLEEESYYGGGDELMHAAFAPNAEHKILITNNEEYGYLASAYVAILDSNGTPVALASVDISMDMINQNILTFIYIALAITVILQLLCCTFYYFYIRKTVIRPTKVLENVTGGLVQKNMEQLQDFKVDLKTGDEFENLGDSFTTMAHELSDYIKNLESVTAEKNRIGAELDVAAHIQSSMLPCIFPAFPDNKNIDIYATMNPAKEVGGDFYDFFFVDPTHFAIVMADVSGKGVPAALFMVIGKTLIKDHTTQNTDLGKVFSEVNDLLCESNSEGLFITAFEGVLDLVTGEFTFVNAGHEMPFISKKNAPFEPYKIKPGFVLAGMDGMKYKAGSFTLEPGDKIFQYTDGVTEATSAQNELYGMERLEKVLGTVSDCSPDQILPAVKKDIDEFVGEAPQFDDITMLCLEFKQRIDPDEKADARNDD